MTSDDAATSLEQELVDIWREVLLDPTVTAESSFWDFGGTSLTAARLLSITRRRTGRTVPFDVLTRNPSPRLLARLLP